MWATSASAPHPVKRAPGVGYRRFVGCDAVAVWSEDYLHYDFGDHPMSPVRLDLTMRLAREAGVLDRLSLLAPVPATDAELRTIHGEAYLAALRTAPTERSDSFRFAADGTSVTFGWYAADTGTGAGLLSIDGPWREDTSAVAATPRSTTPPADEPTWTAPTGCAVYTIGSAATAYLDVKGRIEIDKEISKAQDRLSKANDTIARQKKIMDPEWEEKVSDVVKDQERSKLQDAETEARNWQASIEQFQRLKLE